LHNVLTSARNLTVVMPHRFMVQYSHMSGVETC